MTHGITAVMIGGDDLATTEQFGAEIAPAVRKLVNRERRDVWILQGTGPAALSE